jgi:hypothetical protein
VCDSRVLSTLTFVLKVVGSTRATNIARVGTVTPKRNDAFSAGGGGCMRAS